MYYVKQNNWLGLLFIILGVIFLVVVAGDLLVRLILVVMALALINYGLQLRGMPSLPLLIRMWLTMIGWRNF